MGMLLFGIGATKEINMSDFFKLLFGLIAVVVLVAVLVVPRTDPDGATRVLEAQGYTQIRMTGYRYGMGGEGDIYSTGFEALGPGGRRVSGAVTSGWMKGYTIRLD